MQNTLLAEEILKELLLTLLWKRFNDFNCHQYNLMLDSELEQNLCKQL